MQNLNLKLINDLVLNILKCKDIWVEIKNKHESVIFAVLYFIDIQKLVFKTLKFC